MPRPVALTEVVNEIDHRVCNHMDMAGLSRDARLLAQVAVTAHGTASPHDRRLRSRDRAAVVIGSGLEFYDFIAYAFFALQAAAASSRGAPPGPACCCRSPPSAPGSSCGRWELL